MKDISDRLRAIKTTNNTDKQTIEDVLVFIEKIKQYNEKQKIALALLGYVPKVKHK